MTLVSKQIIFKEDAKSEIDGVQVDLKNEDDELDELNKDLEKL